MMSKWVIKHGMQAVLWFSAQLARRPALSRASDGLMRMLARGVTRSKRISAVADVAALGKAWQRGFPSAKQVPIELISADTVYAQIHTPCPLAGTGDLRACHRMMEYDREVVRHAGGQFVVLESQATPGVKHCRVAMRMKDVPSADLMPAYAASK
jgi:UDP-N-acetyl-D-mannosaminuronate dehydrogenase